LFIRNPDDLAKQACIDYAIDFNDISKLPLEKEAEYIASHAGNKAIVFLDGYAFDEEYQTKIIKKGCFLVCMDDHQDRRYLAHCIINVAELIDLSCVQKPIYSKLVVGFRYALIRPEFTGDGFPTKGLNQLLICFGGGEETMSFISKSVEALSLLDKHFQKVVIIANQILIEDVKRLLSNVPAETNVEVRHSLKAQEMANVMKNSSIAICSSSTVSLECLAMNLKTICGYYVDNQKNLYGNLVQESEIFPAGNLNEINSSQLATLIVNAEKAPEVSKLSTFNLKNIKNNYHKLFSQWEIEMQIDLRKAEKKDADIYLHWANQPDVRLNAIHSDLIIPENHYKWFNNRIISPTTLMLIAEWNGEAVGQIRFDYSYDSWDIAYSVDKRFRGKGLGELLIRKGMWQLLNQQKKELLITAVVKPNNQASNQVFKKLFFKQEENVIRSGIELHNFSLRLNTQFLYL